MPSFEWDDHKDRSNREKHGVSFAEAKKVFSDPHRVVALDTKHSQEEKRFYCFGKVGRGIITVRFTYRNTVVRIIGAGFWRRGKEIYEKNNQV